MEINYPGKAPGTADCSSQALTSLATKQWISEPCLA
jgi:hypothetical protein